MSSTPPSIHGAIRQLRAEIIAPVWELSPHRIIRIRAALASLDSFFVNRSHALTLIKMAASVVDHIEQRGNQANALDFLKENMAHIVSLYEDDEYDPYQEKETSNRVYKRFLRLNISLTNGSFRPATQEQNASELLAKLETLTEETAHLPSLLEQAGFLSRQDRKKAAALLGKISAAIHITRSHIPTSLK